MAKQLDTTQKEFLDYQNSKWTNRRRMAWLSLLFYFAIVAWLVWRTDPSVFGNYDGFMIQLSVFVGAILTNYFVSNSAENMKLDRDSIMKEYIALKGLAQQAREAGLSTQRVEKTDNESVG
jgi:cytosine/uracil/thiamine/allantoin permease